MREKILYVVVPCYNEEEVLPETAKRLRKKLQELIAAELIAANSRIVFVNDGSTDRTWELIGAFHQYDPIFSGVNLSHNQGHQNALLAGLMTVKDHCDFTISMDADLQDDINVMEQMIEKYHQGCEIVYGVRSQREKDSFFKRTTASLFYKLMHWMGTDTIYNHADYRLMSKTALEALSQYREVNLFLRGIVPMLGYQTDTVSYKREERFAGTSKYPFRKMLSFALEGITSFSVKPIRMVTLLGLLIFCISIVMGIYSLARYFSGNTLRGWTSTVLSLWAIGGLILLSLGVVGEYIGKIYLESKARPRYHVQEFLNDDQ